MASHGRAMTRCVLLACLVAASASSTASAFVFKAGGTGEWRVPTQTAGANATNAYNAWAQRNRFRVGDAIGESTVPAPANHRIEYLNGDRCRLACGLCPPLNEGSNFNYSFYAGIYFQMLHTC